MTTTISTDARLWELAQKITDPQRYGKITPQEDAEHSRLWAAKAMAEYNAKQPATLATCATRAGLTDVEIAQLQRLARLSKRELTEIANTEGSPDRVMAAVVNAMPAADKYQWADYKVQRFIPSTAAPAPQPTGGPMREWQARGQAQAEWDQNYDNCWSNFSSPENYKAFREAELMGRVHIYAPSSHTTTTTIDER